jgi:gamma-glutamyltranspeptidase/glutathione hydrolase
MSFNYANPYATTRMPLFARNVVATSHPLAAQAGCACCGKGGNAVDAAIAAAAAMTVCEPTSAMAWGAMPFASCGTAKGLHGLNASGRAPQAWTPGLLPCRKYGRTMRKAPPKRGIDSRHRAGRRVQPGWP